MEVFLNSIIILSGSTGCVFFVLSHIIGWKKEEIDKYSRGEEIEVVDDNTDLSNAVTFGYGEDRRWHRKTEEQIRWEAYSKLSMRVLLISFAVMVLSGMIGIGLGYE